jgi:hypothetical protein
MTDLDQLLTQLKHDRDSAIAEAEVRENQAIGWRNQAAMIDARIGGIEETRKALAARAESVAVVSHEQMRHILRRPRRDIRALVKQTCDDMRSEGWNPSNDQIARRIGCRKSQVEAALKALDMSKSAVSIPTP